MNSLDSKGCWHGDQSRGPWGRWAVQASSLGFAVFPGAGNCTRIWDFVPNSLRHFYYLNGHVGLFSGRCPLCRFSQSGCCLQQISSDCLLLFSLPVHTQEAFLQNLWKQWAGAAARVGVLQFFSCDIYCSHCGFQRSLRPQTHYRTLEKCRKRIQVICPTGWRVTTSRRDDGFAFISVRHL